MTEARIAIAMMVIDYYERDTGEPRLRNKEKCAQPLIGRDATDRERENGTETYFFVGTFFSRGRAGDNG